MTDGALRVVMRGDVYDGRNFIKSAMAGPSDPKIKAQLSRSRSRHQARRRWPAISARRSAASICGCRAAAAAIRSFSLNAKIGRDTPLIGEMRARVNNGRPVLYFETSDAGALFRFTDMYQRMVGGKMWIGMDPPTPGRLGAGGHHQHQRILDPRREHARPGGVECAERRPRQNNNIEFSQARADFTRVAGPHDRQGRRAARADDRRHRRRQHRLCPRPGADARHAGAALRPQQHVRRRFRSSACSSAAAATRACSASPTR